MVKNHGLKLAFQALVLEKINVMENCTHSIAPQKPNNDGVSSKMVFLKTHYEILYKWKWPLSFRKNREKGLGIWPFEK